MVITILIDLIPWKENEFNVRMLDRILLIRLID